MNKITLLGCPIDNLSFDDTLRKIEDSIQKRKLIRHCAINAAKIVKIQSDRKLRETVVSSDLISPDGQSIVWASRFLKKPLPERVTGIDLMQKLLELAARKGYKVFLLGAREEVICKLKEKLKRELPDLNLVGWRNGYFSPAEEEGIVKEINQKKPDILFVGMSSPKKEYWMSKYQSALKVPFCMGVGGGFDVLVGKIKRAPPWIQRVGLEWFYRFLQEPTRMWKRYLVTNTLFLFYLLKEKSKSIKSSR
ncbi:MAG: WecB/TagA/CpsF family glycosyltransferase [candidate division Zixibacteria bacterium]|nr:WecB/TagA/CpsF family glycosyltransferase [candidate division Zixibacteria bacterium]